MMSNFEVTAGLWVDGQGKRLLAGALSSLNHKQYSFVTFAVCVRAKTYYRALILALALMEIDSDHVVVAVVVKVSTKRILSFSHQGGKQLVAGKKVPARNNLRTSPKHHTEIVRQHTIEGEPKIIVKLGHEIETRYRRKPCVVSERLHIVWGFYADHDEDTDNARLEAIKKGLNIEGGNWSHSHFFREGELAALMQNFEPQPFHHTVEGWHLGGREPKNFKDMIQFISHEIVGCWSFRVRQVLRKEGETTLEPGFSINTDFYVDFAFANLKDAIHFKLMFRG